MFLPRNETSCARKTLYIFDSQTLLKYCVVLFYLLLRTRRLQEFASTPRFKYEPNTYYGVPTSCVLQYVVELCAIEFKVQIVNEQV